MPPEVVRSTTSPRRESLPRAAFFAIVLISRETCDFLAILSMDALANVII